MKKSLLEFKILIPNLYIRYNKAYTSSFNNIHTACIFLDQYSTQFIVPEDSCQSWAKLIYHRWQQNGF